LKPWGKVGNFVGKKASISGQNSVIVPRSGGSKRGVWAVRNDREKKREKKKKPPRKAQDRKKSCDKLISEGREGNLLLMKGIRCIEGEEIE